MGNFNFPGSFEDLEPWRRRWNATREEARRRFIQFVVLDSIGSSRLGVQLAFKGGNALRFLHGNDRSTLDLDFTADATLPDDENSIRLALDAALGRAERRHQVKARCQSIRRKPPGTARTRPTYSIKVCYQLPLDRYYQNFAERLTFSEIIEVEISLNDLVCETKQGRLKLDSQPILVCSLEDILGENLRALLQQIPRNSSRPQDL